MKNISIIACVGKKLELGKKNDLIWHLPNDLKYFKKVTSGKTVIMGRRTFDSLPGVLPKRRNIVLQLPNESKIDGVEIFNSIPEIFDNIKDEDEAFIIGGASIYKQFLPYAKKLYLTEVNESCKDPDVYFPKFDKRKYKKTIVGNGEDNNIKYNFVIYERRK
jgi:dihydrofolate reductase